MELGLLFLDDDDDDDRGFGFLIFRSCDEIEIIASLHWRLEEGI